MNLLREMMRRVKMLLSGRQFQDDLEEEMRLHVDLRAQEQMDDGADANAARRAAYNRFGNPAVIREKSYMTWGWEWLESFAKDVLYGLRSMMRSPVLTIVALLSLGLGIGANTAIFSFLDAVLLRDLPVKNPQQLVVLGTASAGGVTNNWAYAELYSYPFFRTMQKDNVVFSDMATVMSMMNEAQGTLDGQTRTQPMNIQLVSGSYFPLVGVKPFMGRALTEADDTVEGGNPVVVVSYAWWANKMAHDPNVLHRTIKLGATVFDIVGVAPREFFGTTVGQAPDMWAPYSMTKLIPPYWGDYTDKRYASNLILGRLKPGVTLAQAQANVNLLFHQIWTSYNNPHVNAEDWKQLKNTNVPLTPIANGLSDLRGQYSKPLQLLMALTTLVLLIACANIANLLLARSTARAREFAMRQALGARRSRLVRQLLTESLVLATVGGGLGIAIAAGADHLLLRMVSTGPNTLPLDVSIHLKLLLFTLGLTVTTALLFGTLPALRATKLELTEVLKDGRGSQGVSRKSPLAKGLVVTQVAISLTLLVGAGLFVHSLINLNNVDTGFNKENVLLLQTDASSIGYKETDPRLLALYKEIEDRVSAVHGVTAESYSSFRFGEGSWNGGVEVPGSDKNDAIQVHHNIIGDGYFKTMGIPLIAGRTFGSEDSATSQKVAIISERFAKIYFPGVNPIGRHYTYGNDKTTDLEIVGIAKDAKFDNLNETPETLDYYETSQHGKQYMNDFSVRYDGDFDAISAAVQRAIHSVNEDLPITQVTTLDAVVQGSITQQRTVAQLSTFFGLLAVFLSCIGIYGLMSYMIGRRTNEIGIRMALGAERGNVMWLVMREIIVMVGIGVAIGIPLTIAASRLIANMLYGMHGADLISLVGATAALIAVGLLAGYLPARRASRVDPMTALRYE